jgi:hypothetical protein
MKQRPRRYFIEPEISAMWDRLAKGESVNAIARDLDRGTFRRTGSHCQKRRHQTTEAQAIASCIDDCRAREDLTRHRRRPCTAQHCLEAASSPVHGEP